jgi:hypothetical protein
MRVVLAVLLAFTTAYAGGVAPERTLTLDELIDEAGFVFAGKVVAVEHSYSTVEAYGQRMKIVSEYRLKVKLGDRLKPSGSDKSTPIVTVVRRGDPPPNAWVVEKRFYASGYDLRGAKVGDAVLVFGFPGASGPVDTTEAVRAEEIESGAHTERVRKRLARKPKAD